jgi:transposase InsO family protein
MVLQIVKWLVGEGCRLRIRRVECSRSSSRAAVFVDQALRTLVYRTSWRTRDEAENAIFTYIDTWYNTRRIQKELGYLSPDEYETAWHTHQAGHTESDIAIPAATAGR